jgi:uncharacterized membrane protein
MTNLNSTVRINMAQKLSLALLIALIFLCLAWELFLAPVRPGGSWLALKALPLMACVWGVYIARRRTFQVLSLLVWLYVLEGLTRMLGDKGASSALSIAEALLAAALFVSVAAYAKWTRPVEVLVKA